MIRRGRLERLELPVGEGFGEVVEADELGRLDQIPVVERDPDHLEQRVDGEDSNKQQRRRQVEKAGEDLALFLGAGDVGDGVDFVGRVVVGGELAQQPDFKTWPSRAWLMGGQRSHACIAPF